MFIKIHKGLECNECKKEKPVIELSNDYKALWLCRECFLNAVFILVEQDKIFKKMAEKRIREWL